MALKVAKTVYETEPDKKLAAVDVYSDKLETVPTNNETKLPNTSDISNITSSTFNSVDKLYTEFEKDFKDVNKSLEQALGSFTNIVKNPKAFAESLSKDVLNDTLKAVGYAGKSDDLLAIAKNGPNVKNILNVVGNSNSDLKMVIDGVEQSIAGKDLSSATGVASLIGELTGNSELVKVLDISPKVSVIKSFVDHAMKLRVPEAVDLLVDSIEDYKDRKDLRLYSTLNAAYNSDIDFLNKQIDSEDIGAGAINGIYPDITTILLSNYVLVDRVPSEQEANKLIATLDKLDPKWLDYDRDGTVINNVSSFAAATEDAINVLLKNERTYLAATLSRQLDTKNMVKATLEMRPYTPPKIVDM